MKPLNDRTDRARVHTTIAELLASWRESLELLNATEENGSKPDDQSVAGYMVGAILEIDENDAAQDYEPLVAKIFDAVVNLETPLVRAGERPQLWAQVKRHVAELEARYS